jgi:hypothetical protein
VNNAEPSIDPSKLEVETRSNNTQHSKGADMQAYERVNYNNLPGNNNDTKQFEIPTY